MKMNENLSANRAVQQKIDPNTLEQLLRVIRENKEVLMKMREVRKQVREVLEKNGYNLKEREVRESIVMGIENDGFL